MDIFTIIGGAFILLFSIAGYLETSARRASARAMELMQQEWKAEVKEIWRELSRIKDDRAERNEDVNEKFSQIEKNLLDKINTITNSIAKLIK